LNLTSRDYVGTNLVTWNNTGGNANASGPTQCSVWQNGTNQYTEGCSAAIAGVTLCTGTYGVVASSKSYAGTTGGWLAGGTFHTGGTLAGHLPMKQCGGVSASPSAEVCILGTGGQTISFSMYALDAVGTGLFSGGSTSGGASNFLGYKVGDVITIGSPIATDIPGQIVLTSVTLSGGPVTGGAMILSPGNYTGGWFTTSGGLSVISGGITINQASVNATTNVVSSQYYPPRVTPWGVATGGTVTVSCTAVAPRALSTTRTVYGTGATFQSASGGVALNSIGAFSGGYTQGQHLSTYILTAGTNYKVGDILNVTEGGYASVATAGYGAQIAVGQVSAAGAIQDAYLLTPATAAYQFFPVGTVMGNDPVAQASDNVHVLTAVAPVVTDYGFAGDYFPITLNASTSSATVVYPSITVN
jgi:hypothetical protein